MKIEGLSQTEIARLAQIQKLKKDIGDLRSSLQRGVFGTNTSDERYRRLELEEFETRLGKLESQQHP